MKYLSFLPDLLIIAGLSGIFYGLHMINPWAAFAVTGALVFGVGVAASIPKKPSE
jgi:hypothetical protein